MDYREGNGGKEDNIKGRGERRLCQLYKVQPPVNNNPSSENMSSGGIRILSFSLSPLLSFTHSFLSPHLPLFPLSLSSTYAIHSLPLSRADFLSVPLFIAPICVHLDPGAIVAHSRRLLIALALMLGNIRIITVTLMIAMVHSANGH